MELKDYEELPEILDVNEIKLLFDGLVADFEKQNVMKDEFLKSLLELTDRQVLTYELLEPRIRKTIDTKMCQFMVNPSYEEVDIILTLMINLGLMKTYERVKFLSENESDLSSEILIEIQDALGEVGDDVSNPYKNMEGE